MLSAAVGVAPRDTTSRKRSPVGRSTMAVATVPVAPAALERRTSEASASPGSWSARHSLLESETVDRPAGDVTFIESGPPLRASGPLPPSLLN